MFLVLYILFFNSIFLITYIANIFTLQIYYNTYFQLLQYKTRKLVGGSVTCDCSQNIMSKQDATAWKYTKISKQ